MTGGGAAVQRARRQASRKRSGGQEEEENGGDKRNIADEEAMKICIRCNADNTFLSKTGGSGKGGAAFAKQHAVFYY